MRYKVYKFHRGIYYFMERKTSFFSLKPRRIISPHEIPQTLLPYYFQGLQFLRTSSIGIPSGGAGIPARVSNLDRRERIATLLQSKIQ